MGESNYGGICWDCGHSPKVLLEEKHPFAHIPSCPNFQATLQCVSCNLCPLQCDLIWTQEMELLMRFLCCLVVHALRDTVNALGK